MYWIALQPQLDAAPLARRAAAAAVVQAPGAGLADPLNALAWWALQFTPKVALLENAVLMEVSSSERLWGGRAALLRHIYTSNKPVALVGYSQGATSLVAFGRLFAAQKATASPDDLPLTVLLAARAHLDTLARLGCTTWGQLRALPRSGVARRFGAALLDALDQAHGCRPDVYPWLILPEVFEATLELPSQVENASALLFGARRLLAQLQVWLQLRRQGVLAIELGWTMDARRDTATHGALVLRTAQSSADCGHLQRLLGEHLDRVTLAAPVQSLRLRSLQTQPLAGASSSLLPDEELPGDSFQQLLERLSARLGTDKVLQLQARADHRPENMQCWHPLDSAEDRAARAPLRELSVIANEVWQSMTSGLHGLPRCARSDERSVQGPCAVSGRIQKARDDGAGSVGGVDPKRKARNDQNGGRNDWNGALRPTWLLAQPLPLEVQHQRPYYQGPLILLAGPQRLEAGWWNPPAAAQAAQTGPAAGFPGACGSLALRDYFVARSATAGLLWIYRERLSKGKPVTVSTWFLHGIFA